MYILGFLLVLGPLITVHELGHYLVGRWFGVGADVFSIGFGKEMFGWTDKRGTRWRVAAIPLGGYVQFRGDMNPASIPEPGAPQPTSDSFQSASLWRRSLIVFAGPATNIIVAIAIYAALFSTFGKQIIDYPEDSTVVASFSEDSAAELAGVEVGDKIVAIDGEEIADFSGLLSKVALFPNREVTLTIERGDAELDLPVTIGSAIQPDRFGNEASIGRLGIYRSDVEEASVTYEEVSLLQAVPMATQQCWDVTVMMVTGIKQIIVGERSVKELGGPLKIAKYSGEQLSLGATTFINFVALISLNLAFINLLPIPALDGGHLAFYAAEAVRRKPIGPRGQEMAFRAGMAFVLVFMVVVTVNDVISLPLFGS
ncbi:MAG: RIP metalloprotease RseP [Parasphingorhabdus sp.]|uniref:RIP metalloprotease RseP n=1 Tax=Parasphingorhabdus sp. TaxID=2709688 RepID=UPI00329808C8